ncbi:MAG: hypothetical protein HYZ16_10245 [Bacteroidetes bacterium]|nr:hypothetical protein [Bacteroidota bacterium]
MVHKLLDLDKSLPGIAVCVISFWPMGAGLYAQTNEGVNEELSSKLTTNFSPTYRQYLSSDTTRTNAVNFDQFTGKKLIFYDNFIDNRNTWPYWSSMGDSILQECLGIDNNFICRTQGTRLADSYTDMADGQKVLACYTPERLFRYTNQVKLGKNYVVTLNPLSIKQVSQLPSSYYEGYCEHTTRVHRSFNGKDFAIETQVAQAVGNWGILFGDMDSDRPYYLYRLNTEGSWAFFAVYPNNRNKPVQLESGSLNIPFAQVHKVGLVFVSNGQGGFKLEFFINDKKAGQTNVTRMPLEVMDIGYRLDHNSIDGNNILIARDLAVYEIPLDTYLEDHLRLTGGWNGAVLRNNNEVLYHVKGYFNEDHTGNITGRLVFTHAKFSDIVVTKKLRAKRTKNIVNFEETSCTVKGIRNKVILFSVLQKGHMDIQNPDSLIISSCLASNLHRYGEFDSRIDLHTDKLYMGRAKRTTKSASIAKYDSINVNKLIEIKRLYFIPNSAELEMGEETKISLDNLARELRRYYARNKEAVLIIHGHTDLGIEQTYSLIRAKSIQAELESRGIRAPIFCIGHGFSQRVSAIHGDPRNRRVEVELVQVDSAWVDNDALFMGQGAKSELIKNLPDEYIVTAQFKLAPGADVRIVMAHKTGGAPLVWQIPNVAGGQMQTLKVRKRYRADHDAIILEFVLDDINYLSQTLTGYGSFGFDVRTGSMELNNLVIFGPE